MNAKKLDKRNHIQIENTITKDKICEQHSRLAAMGEMMDSVAHQWKQPLNSLSMMSDMLKDDYKNGLVDNLYIDDLTTTVDMQIDHMVTTLNENFSIEDTINSIEVLMKDELKHLFINLINNSIDAFNEKNNGKIEVHNSKSGAFFTITLYLPTI